MSVDDKQGGPALSYAQPAGRCRGEWRSRRTSAARTSDGAGTAECLGAAQLLTKLEDQASAGPGHPFFRGIGLRRLQTLPAGRKFLRACAGCRSEEFRCTLQPGLGRPCSRPRRSGYERARDRRCAVRPEDTDWLVRAITGLSEAGPAGGCRRKMAEKARKLAPPTWCCSGRRLVVSKMLAAVYDDYLKLKPADDVARRERWSHAGTAPTNSIAR